MVKVSRPLAMQYLNKLYLQRYGEPVPSSLKLAFIDEFVAGINVELEHAGTIERFAQGADPLEIAGSIALDHLDEDQNYYSKHKKAGL